MMPDSSMAGSWVSRWRDRAWASPRGSAAPGQQHTDPPADSVERRGPSAQVKLQSIPHTPTYFGIAYSPANCWTSKCLEIPACTEYIRRRTKTTTSSLYIFFFINRKPLFCAYKQYFHTARLGYVMLSNSDSHASASMKNGYCFFAYVCWWYSLVVCPLVVISRLHSPFSATIAGPWDNEPQWTRCWYVA